MSAVVGRRCALGCCTWPDKNRYSICPKCDHPTRRIRGLTPISKKEALSKVRHIEFEEYYEHEHIKDLDPLTDEELAEMGILAEAPNGQRLVSQSHFPKAKRPSGYAAAA